MVITRKSIKDTRTFWTSPMSGKGKMLDIQLMIKNLEI